MLRISKTFKKLKNTTRPAIAAGGLAVLASPMVATAAENKNNNSEKPSDIDVRLAIDGQLFDAKAVDANQINVSVDDGIVELSGTASNILAKQRAVQIAEKTKGVRSIINRLDVKRTEMTDKQIRRNIISSLASDPATDSWKLDVEVDDGNVTLTGELESLAARDLAESVAKTVTGVRSIESDIDIVYDAVRADYEIENEIRQRFKYDIRFDDEVIDVDVEDSKVTLSGSVGSRYEVQLASFLASINGVTEVDTDELTVDWWSRDEMQRKPLTPQPLDRKIDSALQQAFLHDPRVESFDILTIVSDGEVTLSGTVDNLKAKNAAEQDAKNTFGVLSVNNLLRVQPGIERSPIAIEQEIESALQRSVVVDRQDVEVSVFGNIAYLSGDVDFYYERRQAEDVASRVRGVSEVRNNIDVRYGTPAYDYATDWDSNSYTFDLDYQTVRSRPDDEIKKEIESELWWSPFVDRDEVKVTVNDGVATLTGTVDSYSERQSAAENAIDAGAYKVKNKLDIE